MDFIIEFLKMMGLYEPVLVVVSFRIAWKVFRMFF